MWPKNLREEFPILKNNPQLKYFDSAATSQKPNSVLQAEMRFYEKYNANVHRGTYRLAEQATRVYEESRIKVANFLGAQDSSEIVFTKNATEAINLVAECWGRSQLQKNPQGVFKILTTELEHHSNYLPWWRLQGTQPDTFQFLKVGLNAQENFDLDSFLTVLKNEKPQMVTITQLSNALGIELPVKQIIEEAHKIGAVVLVDACQSVGRLSVNVQDLDADFLVFSAHKVYGPMGVGVLYAKKQFLDKLPLFLIGGGTVDVIGENYISWSKTPECFEAGTPNVAGAFALAEALNFIDQLGLENVTNHDRVLTSRCYEALSQMEFVRVFGPQNSNNRAGLISFVVDGVHAQDLAAYLDQAAQICLRVGTHCAQPLLQALGVKSTARISFGAYNTESELEEVIQELSAAIKFLRR